MKKSKGQTVDLLYTNKKEEPKKSNKQTNKKANNVGTNSTRQQKNKKTKTKKVQNDNNERINLDNEIIIGLTSRKQDEKKQKNTRTKKTNLKNKKIKNINNVGKHDCARTTKNNKNNLNKNKQQNTKNKRKNRCVKWIILSLLLLTVIILFLMSNVFNIKQIVVVNNSKISSNEIINSSTLATGVNMFKITNGAIRNGVKTNAYIEDVSIKRNINGTVVLDVKERQATYMLKLANAYVYINNQGYMLEISENPLELPTIIGFSTPNEEMEAGKRLNTEDLQKLEDVIKIMETAKNSSLVNIITEIDVSDSMYYNLTVESEQKTVIIGNMTNINIKLQMAGKVFEAEKGKIGEIYFQDDGKKAVFKEEVSR